MPWIGYILDRTHPQASGERGIGHGMHEADDGLDGGGLSGGVAELSRSQRSATRPRGSAPARSAPTPSAVKHGPSPAHVGLDDVFVDANLLRPALGDLLGVVEHDDPVGGGWRRRGCRRSHLVPARAYDRHVSPDPTTSSMIEGAHCGWVFVSRSAWPCRLSA
jgi:hypothetical protein